MITYLDANVVLDLLHVHHYEIDETLCVYTHTPFLVIANMVDLGEVQNHISALIWLFCKNLIA